MTERARSFGAVAAAYDRARPGYPQETVRWSLPFVPCRAADVGAGTGKLTAVLVALGCDVVAVEPDDAMRARIDGAKALASVAEALPLADGSVDAVLAAQAFQWFDADRFVGEALRVLRPAGTIGILRNDLDPRFEWVNDFARIETWRGGPVLPDDPSESPLDDPRLGTAAYAEAAFVHRLDAEGLAALVASFSPVALLPTERRASLLAEVVREAHVRFGDDPVELRYVSRAWRFTRC